MIPILGVTWIFGIMAFNDSSIVFQYIFAIVNSIQVCTTFCAYQIPAHFHSKYASESAFNLNKGGVENRAIAVFGVQ